MRLLAWDDAVLEHPVFLLLVFGEEAGTLDELAGRVPLGELVDAVRMAHAKLPSTAAGPEAAGAAAPAASPKADPHALDFPSDLARLRFVLPEALESAVGDELLRSGGFGSLRGPLVGRGEGGAFGRLGLLGRAAVEERTATADQPWLYVSLVQTLRYVSDAIHRKLVDQARVREACDTLRAELTNWTARLVPTAHRSAVIARLLQNPLAPLVLRRAVPPAAAGEAAAQVLEKPNSYGLTTDQARALDAHFGGATADLLDVPGARDAMEERSGEVLDTWAAYAAFGRAQRAARRRFLLVAAAIFLVSVAAVTAAGPRATWMTRLPLGAAAGAVIAATLGVAGFVQLAWRRLTAPVPRRYRRLARALRKGPGMHRFARGGDWRRRVPELVASWRKLKADILDADTLSRMTLPPLDSASLYAEGELADKWNQNACVCYDDAFLTLTKGATETAGVYFIDVVGSTELSTREIQSNALELYTRMLKVANEAGREPRWRKEIGDGRIYCHPAPEALRRAILSVQGAAHPKVGLEIGIGLATGEIFRDVTTGDFMNEATNRASRLNGRDYAAGAYTRARYQYNPHRVHVRWGNLYNGGLAIDEATLRSLGAEPPAVAPPTPVVEWKFPAGTGEGQVMVVVTRPDPADARQRLTLLESAPLLERHRTAGARALYFEAFVHRGATGPATHLGGVHAAQFLEHRGANHAAYAARTVEHEEPVTRLPVTLPTGQTIMLAVKRERAYLKGLGAAIIAEAEIPGAMPDEPAIGLGKFLAGL